MLHGQMYYHSIKTDEEWVLPIRPHECVAHLHAAITNGQHRWGVVKNARYNVLIQFFNMDVLHILSHRRPIGCMKGDSMFGRIDKHAS